MKFRITKLVVALKQDTVAVDFGMVSYFHGRMGAGKTSVVRLIDYCLGGSLDPSPALQSEFVSATLELVLASATLSVERPRDSERVVARWTSAAGLEQVSLPARKPAGVVIPGTEVENLSDLVFHLSGIPAPKVRTSKTREDSDLQRLSLRDLLWYCYVDQDEIDSTFFHLDKQNDFKQLKSRDVLRFILGFRTERIAEIESELDRLRGERQALSAIMAGFRRALAEVGVDSEGDLLQMIETLENEADEVDAAIETARASQDLGIPSESHAVDTLKRRARDLGNALEEIDNAMAEVHSARDQDRRHLHEIQTLTLKVRRSSAAKEILRGVAFSSCPRCTQHLPQRQAATCPICGQPDSEIDTDPIETALLERDAKSREQELVELFGRQSEGLERLVRRRDEVAAEKRRAERDLGEASRVYDSAFLSSILSLERDRASVRQRAEGLRRLLRLPQLALEQQGRLEHIQASEAVLRADLKTARTAAERDAGNLDRLKDLFLECLLRTSVPGISPLDRVEIQSTNFLPQLWGPDAVQATVTSFSNMSSGGKKTLFKACFAVAVHRLAVEVGATLPEWLAIDSPMKNISERENRTQFENFHRMIYELALGELAGTQFILVDKEYFGPTADLPVDITQRHMQPNEPDIDNLFPPLIPYYTGH